MLAQLSTALIKATRKVKAKLRVGDKNPKIGILTDDQPHYIHPKIFMLSSQQLELQKELIVKNCYDFNFF